jgi:glycosyltransferase involved in cell wall biosynthesis
LNTNATSPISVCTVSGAEAGRIGRALESVAGWTREIILVLNEEVRDGTEEVARKHGAKIFREPWKGMIAQKASAAQKASCDWILDLDADEEVSLELRQQMESAVAGSGPSSSVAAFSYPRLSWYCGRWIRHGDWYPDRQTRLWRRGRGKWGGTDPHAKLLVDGPVQKLSGDLRHYSNESINRHVQKIVPFSDDFVRQMAATAPQPGVFDLAVRPLWRFLRAYIFRLGFLDGWPGYYIACLNSFSTATRYAKLREARAQDGGQSRESG